MKYKIDEATGLPILPEEGMYWEIGDSETNYYSRHLIDGNAVDSTPALFLKQSKTIISEGVRDWRTLWLTKRTTSKTEELHIDAERYVKRNLERDERDDYYSHFDSLPLDKETTLKLAEKILDWYWDSLQTQALQEDARRTLQADRAKIYGKYPPRKLS